MNQTQTCPLCETSNTAPVHIEPAFQEGSRSFHQCAECRLIFVPQECHISLKDEKARYSSHNNSPEDEGYVKFLNQLVRPFLSYIEKDSKGIDFGCGPGPALSSMLAAEGIEVVNYDPQFFADDSLLKGKYDFLISTEVLEHLRNPRKDMALINSLVKKGGVLGFMTLLYDGEIDFASWWYKNDPTHITFYTKETFEWVAQHFGWEILEIKNRVIIFQQYT